MSRHDEEEVSLFGYYVRAAKAAAMMGVGLGYAFDKYIKPTMPNDGCLPAFTHEEAAAIFASEKTPDSLEPAAATGHGKTR